MRGHIENKNDNIKNKINSLSNNLDFYIKWWLIIQQTLCTTHELWYNNCTGKKNAATLIKNWFLRQRIILKWILLQKKAYNKTRIVDHRHKSTLNKSQVYIKANSSILLTENKRSWIWLIKSNVTKTYQVNCIIWIYFLEREINSSWTQPCFLGEREERERGTRISSCIFPDCKGWQTGNHELIKMNAQNKRKPVHWN